MTILARGRPLGGGLSVRGATLGATRGGVAATPSPPVISAVSISGPSPLRVGDTAVAIATVTGSPTPARTYQWALDGAPISGATGQAHVNAATGDLTVAVSATNSQGSAGPVTSAPVTVEASAAALWGGAAALWAGDTTTWGIAA